MVELTGFSYSFHDQVLLKILVLNGFAFICLCILDGCITKGANFIRQSVNHGC